MIGPARLWQRCWSRLRRFEELTQMLFLGNAIAASGFLILLFGFFTGACDWPLGWLLGWPFSNLYLLLFGRQIDRILEDGAGRTKVFFLYLGRLVVLLVPLLTATLMWYYNLRVFNPISVALSFVLFRMGIYFIPRKDDENGQS